MILSCLMLHNMYYRFMEQQYGQYNRVLEWKHSHRNMVLNQVTGTTNVILATGSVSDGHISQKTGQTCWTLGRLVGHWADYSRPSQP